MRTPKRKRRVSEPSTNGNATETPPERCKVLLSLPGPSFMFGAVCGAMFCSKEHDIEVSNLGGGWDSFNAVWAEALNGVNEGTLTHFAMLHSDIAPEHWWIDTGIREMDRLGLGVISFPAPIKDMRAICSCGVGDPNSWTPMRRWTVQEILDAPKDTFDAADMGYPGLPLLHNNGLWIADLRDPRWQITDADGRLISHHNFQRAIKMVNGRWTAIGESEDWWFSKAVHGLGIKSAISRLVKLTHRGWMDFPNHQHYGQWKVDKATKGKWSKWGKVKKSKSGTGTVDHHDAQRRPVTG